MNVRGCIWTNESLLDRYYSGELNKSLFNRRTSRVLYTLSGRKRPDKRKRWARRLWSICSKIWKYSRLANQRNLSLFVFAIDQPSSASFPDDASRRLGRKRPGCTWTKFGAARTCSTSSRFYSPIKFLFVAYDVIIIVILIGISIAPPKIRHHSRSRLGTLCNNNELNF